MAKFYIRIKQNISLQTPPKFVKITKMARIKLNQNLIWPLVVLLVAFGAFWLKPWQQKPQETISVTAEGKTQVTPNIAKISATVETKKPNLDNARRENEQKVSSLVNKLRELGIDEKDIKTQNISAGPGFEIQPYPPIKPTTNQVSTTLEVTIRDFKKSDTIIAALTEQGATNLYGPNLTIDDQTLEQAKSKAREAAVDAARQKSQELAKLSRRKIGKVVKISEQGDFSIPPPIFAQGAVELQQKASQIQPGQNEVTISLQVDFSLR
ncbi:hypothetical protein A3C33_04900 [Candidatus Curtissbacteria bacterium RIFCSPHIGHO2_02_FULL_42_58]|nr:MAG: hypothetical protein A3C33_04900 [Candidatus Curtissbacteria bacterium RIFCSPHIGHO2_02_FULL_42_58]OGD96775.1 MAG: hypothetical protein A3E71_01345 [Candidatus Curtissbacteria bacterium RIFCSPHIGHO2_12_FULL_42_33]